MASAWPGSSPARISARSSPGARSATRCSCPRGRRRSIVHDRPGVTRDRLHGTAAFERWQATVVDTGGFDPGTESNLIAAVRDQVMAAIAEADLVVFVVDGRAGLTSLD